MCNDVELLFEAVHLVIDAVREVVCVVEMDVEEERVCVWVEEHCAEFVAEREAAATEKDKVEVGVCVSV